MRAALATVLLAIGSGCGTDKQPPILGDPDSSTVTIVKSGGCSVEGEIVACQVVTGQSGTVTNCFHGVQICTSGIWSVCENPPSDAGTASDADTSDADASDAATE